MRLPVIKRRLLVNFRADPAVVQSLYHALVMRNLKHEWHRADDLYAIPQAAVRV